MRRTQEQLQDQTAEGSSIEEEEKTDATLPVGRRGAKGAGLLDKGGFAHRWFVSLYKTAEGIYQAAKRHVQPLQK